MKLFKLSVQAENLLFLLSETDQWYLGDSESFLYHRTIDIRIYLGHTLFSVDYNQEDITSFFSWYELRKIKKASRTVGKLLLPEHKARKLSKKIKAFNLLGE